MEAKRHSGQALVEHLVLWPTLVLLTMTCIQLGLLFRGKMTLEHATFMAAREGALNHAATAPMKQMLAQAMAPLTLRSNPNPLSYATAVATTYTENLALPAAVGGAGITVISPTRAIFNRFATARYMLEPCAGSCPGGGDFREANHTVRQIPNDNLSMRSSATAVITSGGSSVAMNVQDANLLKIRTHWCFGLEVPVAAVTIYRTLNLLGDSTAERRACQVRTIAHNAVSAWPVYYIPLSAGSVVRMQSPVRCEDSECSNLPAPPAP